MLRLLAMCIVHQEDIGILLFLLICGFIGFSLLLYYKLRPRFPVHVTCWFCGKDTVVPFGNYNCWDCPACDQFNGFKEDGDYNKPIPAQYDESLNFPVLGCGVGDLSRKHKFSTTNGLCSDCNNNQSIKMKLLADFVPFNQVNFSQEVDAYHRHLEKVYRLCWKCEMNVQKTLGQQDLELQSKLPPPSYDSSSTANRTIDVSPIPPSCCRKLPLGIHVLDIISLVSLAALLLAGIFEAQEETGQHIFPLSWIVISQLPTAPSLLVTGMVTSIGGIFWAGRSRARIVDALLSFSWVLLQCIYSVLMSNLLQTLSFTLLRPFVVFFTLLLSLISTFWRLTANDLKAYRLFRTLKLTRPSNFIPTEPIHPVKKGFDAPGHIAAKPDCIPNGKQFVDPLIPLRKGIGAIHISSHIKPSYSETGSISSQLTLYKSSHHLQPLIRPARFTPHPVAHTSWVAGGYWSIETSSKARNSISASAGLLTPPPSVCGSQESRSASRTGSMCGEDPHSINESTSHWVLHSSKIRSWPPSAAREQPVQWDRNTTDTGGSHSHSSITSCSLSSHTLPQSPKTRKEELSKTGGIWKLFAWLSFRWLMIISITFNILLLAYFVILPNVHIVW